MSQTSEERNKVERIVLSSIKRIRSQMRLIVIAEIEKEFNATYRQIPESAIKTLIDNVEFGVAVEFAQEIEDK